METNILEVQVRGVVPTAEGCALFISCPQKTFVIYLDPVIGNLISMTLNNVTQERPLTHDLVMHICQGLGAEVDRVVINHTHEGTFFARLILRMHNEVATKVLEVDARPSDSIIFALKAGKPIFVEQKVLDAVEDMSQVFDQIIEEQQG